jgi:hypothetical protein
MRDVLLMSCTARRPNSYLLGGKEDFTQIGDLLRTGIIAVQHHLPQFTLFRVRKAKAS